MSYPDPAVDPWQGQYDPNTVPQPVPAAPEAPEPVHQAQQQPTASVDVAEAFYHHLQGFAQFQQASNATQAATNAALEAIANQLRALSVAPAPAAPRHRDPEFSGSTRTPTIKFREPRTFNGKADQVHAFIRDIRACIELQVDAFFSDRRRALYLSLYLGESAIAWYNAITVSPERKYLLDDFEALLSDFEAHFLNVNLVRKAHRDLENLRQTGSVSAYASRFREILVYLNLSEETKIEQFYSGLKDPIKDNLSGQMSIPTESLDNYIEYCIRIDDRLHERELERRHDSKSGTNRSRDQRHQNSNRVPAQTARPLYTDSSAQSQHTPMEIDAVRQGPLSEDEKTRRRKEGLCLYCGQGDHIISKCPNMSDRVKKSFEQRRANYTNKTNSSAAAPTTSSSGKA